MRTIVQRSLAPVLAAALVALFAAVGNARADVRPEDVPADLQAAIHAKVTGEGKQYAGLCRAIDQPANVGKYCAFVLTLTATTAEVSYGRVLSEPEARVTFTRQDGRWVLPGQAEEIPQDLRDAVKRYIEGRGHTYAGLCTEIAQDGSNIGKYCAAISNITAGSATVHYGPVASNAITEVSFRKTNGTWAATNPATPAPRPPATGGGEGAADDWNPLGTTLPVVAGVALALTLGYVAARGLRRS